MKSACGLISLWTQIVLWVRTTSKPITRWAAAAAGVEVEPERDDADEKREAM